MKTIPLTQGLVAVVDDEDYERLSRFKWCAHRSGKNTYAVRTVKHRGVQWTEQLHRVIMQPPDDMLVDHIDGNPLNNRRSNLRVVTQRENLLNVGLSAANKSGYRGVTWNALRRRWQANVKTYGKSHYLGLFDTPEDAARAYNEKAAGLFGEFARLNQID